MNKPRLNELDQLAALDPMRDFEPTTERRARAAAGLDDMMRESAPPAAGRQRTRWLKAGRRGVLGGEVLGRGLPGGKVAGGGVPGGKVAGGRALGEGVPGGGVLGGGVPGGKVLGWGIPGGGAHRSGARRLVFGGVVTTAAAAVAVAAVQLVPGGDGNQAYAWTAKPQAVAGADALAQARQCAAGWTDWTIPPTAADIVLSERRGTATLLLVRKGSTDVTSCFVLDPAQGAAGGDLLDTSSGAPAGGRVLNDSMGAIEGSHGWYSSMMGRAGTGVEKVEIELPDGTEVRASLSNGWWAAWWPGREGGRADGVRIVVHTKDGSRDFKPSEVFAAHNP